MKPARTAAGRYEILSKVRQPYLDRARECSEVTIPHLFPPEHYGDSDALLAPDSSLPARGVSNISSKLMLTILPPNSPFYKYEINPKDIPAPTGDQQQDNEIEKQKASLDLILSRMEQITMSDIEGSRDRTTFVEGMKHNIVGGNVLFHDDDDEGLRMFRLDSYVVRREYYGKPIEIITKENVSEESLSDDLLKLIEEKRSPEQDKEQSNTGEKPLYLYTHLTRQGETWRVYQEIESVRVPGSEGTYKHNNLPYYPLRFFKEDGRDYSRSFIEDHFGDITTFQELTRSMKEVASESSRILHLVRPGAATDVEEFQDAETGDFIVAEAEDILPYQLNKFADMQSTVFMLQELKKELQYTFLLNSAIQRDAERVTATEIQYIAQEIETSLGGYYSVLAQEFQAPYIKRKYHKLKKAGVFPEMPKDSIMTKIVTGVEALGRGQDLQKLDTFWNIPPNIPAEMLIPYINIGEYLKRREAGAGLFGLVKTEEEVQQIQQQQMQQQMMQQVAPEIVKQASTVMQQGEQEPTNDG